jgi:nicotinamidase-related amidase
MPQKLILSSRYYRAIPLDQCAYEIDSFELDPTRTALIALHCWNIGCEDGPPVDRNFLVGMGSQESFRLAGEIMRDKIRPAMEAARKAGILVCHVEHPDIWNKHPACKEELLPADTGTSYFPPPVVPGWNKRLAARSHGKDYATLSPYARMDRAKIVEARPGEPFVYETNQFDRVLRKYKIENLIYTGFAADMCILFAPGGTQAMNRFGYRLFLMRDATVGIEFPDLIEHMPATTWAIRFFETHFGDTVTSNDFIQACGKLK